MKRYCVSIILLCLLVVSACSIVKPVSIPKVSTYALVYSPSSDPLKRHAPSLSNGTLLVTMPIASPGYQTSAMLYQKTAYRLEHFATHQWVASPAQMLLPILVQAIQSTPVFHAVVAAPFSGRSDYRLDTHLISFKQEFLAPVSRIHLVVQANFIDARRERVLATEQFDIRQSAPANNPFSGVLAANRAVNELSNQVARFVARVKRQSAQKIHSSDIEPRRSLKSSLSRSVSRAM